MAPSHPSLPKELIPMSFSVPRRARRALLAAAVPAALAATALPASADAATVTRHRRPAAVHGCRRRDQRHARGLHRHAHPHPRQRPDHGRRRLRDRRHRRRAVRARQRPGPLLAGQRVRRDALPRAARRARGHGRRRRQVLRRRPQGLDRAERPRRAGRRRDRRHRHRPHQLRQLERRAPVAGQPVQRRQPRQGEHPLRLRGHRRLEGQRHPRSAATIRTRPRRSSAVSATT